MNHAPLRRAVLALVLASSALACTVQAAPHDATAGRGPVLQGWSLNGPGLVLQGKLFNGPGLVLQGKLFNGPGLVLQGKLFNGPGLVLQGRTFNGPGLVLQGSAMAGMDAQRAAGDCNVASHGVCRADVAADAPRGHSVMSGLASAQVTVTLASR
jgi:hypothetical protein